MEQSSEQSTDQSMDQDDGGRWLTYPELSAVRGIDKPSAIRLATRKKWRRQRDNHRVVRVLVPPEWMSPRYQSMDQPMERWTPDMDRPMDQQARSMDRSSEQQSRAMDRSSDGAGFTATLAALEAAHAGEIAALHGQIDGLKTVADRSMDQLADANRRADAAEAGRQEAIALVEQTVALLTDERGRGERAEAARQQDATLIASLETDLQAKVAEAAALRDQLGGVEQTVREAEQAARIATDALNAARRTRKARGRLRRAWDGWRGR
jgi:hypothetical protein